MKRFLVAILLLMLVSLCFAGTTGKLAGRVKDYSGAGLDSVNVIVVRDSIQIRSVLTRENGTYIIINIPPGVYEVKYQLDDYALVIVTSVKINVDETTTQNATMTEKSTTLEKIVVPASHNIIHKDPCDSQQKNSKDS